MKDLTQIKQQDLTLKFITFHNPHTNQLEEILGAKGSPEFTLPKFHGQITLIQYLAVKSEASTTIYIWSFNTFWKFSKKYGFEYDRTLHFRSYVEE